LDHAYNEDLRKLSQIHQVYNGLNKKNSNIMADIVASVEDKIEPSGMLFIGQQNKKKCRVVPNRRYMHD
jgi:hypothetical protein